MNPAAKHFALLREYLNGEKTAKTWQSIKSALSKRTTKSAQFVAEFEPVVLETLESTWPMELRVVDLGDPPHVRRYGCVIRLYFVDVTMRQSAETHGKKYGKGISKKLLKEMVPCWFPEDGPSYRGLILCGVDKLHVHALEALLATGKFEELEFVRLIGLEDRRGQGRESGMYAMMHALIDARGQTLRSFGGSVSFSTARADELYGPLIERVGELPDLTDFEFFSPRMRVFGDVMAEPGFDRVDTLSFRTGFERADAECLLGREASLNLRRVGIGYAQTSRMGVTHEDLVDAPNLANVEAWDFKEQFRDHQEWDTESVRRWADHKAGIQRDELAFDLVDLCTHTTPQTQAALLDEQGALRPSTELRALRIAHITYGGLFTILSTAHEAWPNLECLVFQFDMHEPEVREAWESSPLLDRLAFLDWDDTRHDLTRTLSQYNVGKKQAAENLEVEIERVLDGSMHRVLAFRHWRIIRGTVRNKPHASVLAKGLGLEGYSKEPLGTILDLCEAEVAERLGGRSTLACDGPQWAYMSGTGRFEWKSTHT